MVWVLTKVFIQKAIRMKKLIYILFLLPLLGFSQSNKIARAVEISRQQASTADPLDLSGLVASYKTGDTDASVQSDPISNWNDSTNNNDATQTGTPQPTLNIVSGTDLVTFDGANDWMNIGTPAVLDFAPGTDPFCIVIKTAGSVATTGYHISKAGGTASLRQYGIYLLSNQYEAYVGGTRLQSTTNPASNDLIILNVNTSTADMYINSTKIIDAGTIGTATNSDDINIGSRTNGSFLYDGELQFIYIYDRELTSGEIAAIQSQYNG